MGEAFEWRGKPCLISNYALANPVIGDLTRHKWYGPVPTRDEERDLVRRAQADDDHAKQRLLEAHDRDLRAIASEYNYGPPLEFEELLQTAREGFLKAVDDFDPGRNFRLATLVGKYARTEVWTAVRSIGRKWPAHEHYDTIEAGYTAPRHDDDEHGGRRAGPVVRLPWESRRPDAVMDYAALLTDQRNMQRLRLIGRRAYALELVENKRKRLERGIQHREKFHGCTSHAVGRIGLHRVDGRTE
jgi:hypothetical protein